MNYSHIRMTAIMTILTSKLFIRSNVMSGLMTFLEMAGVESDSSSRVRDVSTGKNENTMFLHETCSRLIYLIVRSQSIIHVRIKIYVARSITAYRYFASTNYEPILPGVGFSCGSDLMATINCSRMSNDLWGGVVSTRLLAWKKKLNDFKTRPHRRLWAADCAGQTLSLTGLPSFILHAS